MNKYPKKTSSNIWPVEKVWNQYQYEWRESDICDNVTYVYDIYLFLVPYALLQMVRKDAKTVKWEIQKHYLQLHPPTEEFQLET